MDRDMVTPGTHAIDSPLQSLAERPAGRVAGLPMFCLCLLVVAGGAWVVHLGSAASGSGTGATLAILGGVLLLLLGALGFRGLIAVGPGQARVVQLFGRYTGTVRTPGLQWVNPFTTRHTISTRIRNHETPVLKVNEDEERKAAMASNLLVVLCSEQATQPVVTTGTLYQ